MPSQVKTDMENKKILGARRTNLKFGLQPRSPNISVMRLCLEEVSKWSHSLEALLSSKYGMKIFQAFLKSEFSDENIEFWLVCEDFKKIKSSLRMSCRARKIFKRYVQVEAPREINIDQRTREVIRRNLETPTTESFDAAQRIVYALMEKDSYPRFIKSDIYQALLNSTIK
ncbi:regulator of G-protein signaling 8-like [Cynoglossus semilaevis]|uniref:Regulator of G protein signaling 13a n=1 Tax=Cynoglossus semilaevis TaxID=244447 RepID=A0A3P8VSY6_CYNSE|nr:regulator of G-protein signaling 8-like [Cynoglossus semilaevis]